MLSALMEDHAYKIFYEEILPHIPHIDVYGGFSHKYEEAWLKVIYRVGQIPNLNYLDKMEVKSRIVELFIEYRDPSNNRNIRDFMDRKDKFIEAYRVEDASDPLSLSKKDWLFFGFTLGLICFICVSLGFWLGV